MSRQIFVGIFRDRTTPGDSRVSNFRVGAREQLLKSSIFSVYCIVHGILVIYSYVLSWTLSIYKSNFHYSASLNKLIKHPSIQYKPTSDLFGAYYRPSNRSIVCICICRVLHRRPVSEQHHRRYVHIINQMPIRSEP